MSQKLLGSALLCSLFVSLLAAAPAFAPEKALINKTSGQPVTVEKGVFSVANLKPGRYSGMFFNLAGMTWQNGLKLVFEYRTTIPAGGKVRYVGVAFHSKTKGMSFNSFEVSETWQTASLDFKKLKFHKKVPPAAGDELTKLHIYCRMPDDALGTAKLELRNIRFEVSSPETDFNAVKSFVRNKVTVSDGSKDGIFISENKVPANSVPVTFNLNGMPYRPEYRMCFEYRSKVLSEGKERYIGINFAHRTGGTTFSSVPASTEWAKGSVALAGLKFHKAGKLKAGEPLQRVTIYSRLEASGLSRLEVRNVRFEKDPLYDAKANVRLSYSALPLISWAGEQGEIYTVDCSRNGESVYSVDCNTPYFVPEKVMKPGMYDFRVTAKKTGKLLASEEIEIPEKFHSWELPAYDFAAFAARPRPRLKKLAQFFNPDTEQVISSARRNGPSTKIPPNPEPYKEGADPNIRSWVEWYGKVAGGIVARTGGKLQQLGQAAVLSDDPALQKLAGEKALIIARTWDPDSGSSMSRGDLQAASLLRGLVWCYDGAYNVLTPAERKELASCIRVRGNQFWKSTYPFRSNESQNHPWDRAEAAAFAAVGLAEEPDMPVRFDYIARLYAYRILPSLGFKGENNEGLKYWSYGLGLAVRFVDVARYAVGLSYYGHPWLKQTARFPLYGMPARGVILSFGDNGVPNHASIGPLNRTFTGKLAAEAGDAAALWYAGYPERNGVAAKPPVDIPQSIDYDHLGIALFNTFLADGRENVALGFHSGKFFAGHQHPDNNSFIINAYGDKLAIDGGYYDWYGSRHFKAYSFTTKAHNTILVNGKEQKPRVPGGDGKMTGYFDSPNFGFVSGDASNPKIYMGELKRFDRDILFLKPDFVAVYDRLAADKPSKFQWLMHSHSAKPMDYAAGKFSFERPLARMSGVMLLPEKFTGFVAPSYSPEVGPVLGYSETKNPDPQPEWTLTVENADAAKETEFLSVMQIARAREACNAEWRKAVTESAVAAMSKNAAVIFRRTDSGAAVAGPFKTDARAAAVILNDDGTVFDAMMKDGSYLEYNGKTLLKGKGSLALKKTADVENRKVAFKMDGKTISADYRIQRLAFGREIHLLTGVTDIAAGAHCWAVEGAIGTAPVSIIFMQQDRFLCGDSGTARAYFLNEGKVAFSFASSKPFRLPEFISMGDMKILKGKAMPTGWQPPANAVKFEAENMFKKSDPAAVVAERPSASGGRASCHWNEEGQWAIWKFTVPADGKYQLGIAYATTLSRVERELMIDGKYLCSDAAGMTMPSSGGFGYAPAEWRWCLFPRTIELKAGEHELYLAMMQGTANLDAFTLIPVR